MKGGTNAQVVQRSTDGMAVRDLRKIMGTAPSQDMWSSISILDKYGQQIGQLSQIQFPDGNVRTSIGVRRDASNNAFLDLQMQTDGTVYIITEKTVNGVYSSKIIDVF